MSITTEDQMTGMQKISELLPILKAMTEYVKPGMTTKDLDEYGGKILSDFGAKSSPLPYLWISRLDVYQRG
jgi:methionyl aminopeptidase